jgi:hypothetical protein
MTDMADDQAATQAATQAGQAVPQPASVIRTPSTAEQTRPAPAPAADSPEGRVAAARTVLAEAEAALPWQPGTIGVKVEPPHSEFHFGGVSLYEDFRPVNELMLPHVQQAADAAGVKLTTE